MNASDLFVRQLKEEGVKYIFGLPGEENLYLLEAIRKSDIKLIVTRHEQGAAFMAATYGRLTGKAGVCLSTLGPGATNLVTGIAHAQLIGAPLVSISGQKAITRNRQARFQLVDIVSLMKPVTKKSVTIVDPNNIPTVIRDAFKTAETERPGAVHIELPEDVASMDAISSVQERTFLRRPAPDAKAVEKAALMINQSSHPLIIVSGGANRNQITKALQDFIDKTGIFVVHTQMGKGVIPDDCDCSLYATGIHGPDYVNCAIDKSDLIITIGYNIAEYPPYIWNRDAEKKIINIDFVQSEPDRYYNPEIEVLGNVSETLNALGALLQKREFPDFERTRELVEKKINEDVPRSYPLHPLKIVRKVRSVLGKDDILALDNGIYKLWFSRLYKTYSPNTFLLDNALAAMGAGLPTAMTAKLLNPDKKVIAAVGDGGFLMNSQELETAKRYNLPVVVLILRDDAYGFIKWKQQVIGLPVYGMDYSNPDFVRLAEAYGIKGFRVQKGEDLSVVLKNALDLDELAIVECPIDYAVNYDVFSKELSGIVCGNIL